MLTTPAACVGRMQEIKTETDRLKNFGKLTGAQEIRTSQLLEEFAAVDKRRRELEREEQLDKVRAAAGGGAVEHGTPFGSYRPSVGGTERDNAMRVLDGLTRSGELPDYGAERVERLMTNGARHEQGVTAQWTTATGDPAYLRAFAKLCADPERGHMEWDEQERGAYQRVREVQGLMRSMSLTDNAGGYMVPLTLDPAILLTNNGSINPLRQISRTVQTATDTWNGVTSAGVTAEWTAEGAEVADASPTLGQPSIPVHKGDAYVEYSFEVGMDAMNFLAELQGLLVDAADQLNATAYTTGTGSGQPTGIITALDGTSSEVAPATPETLASGDVYAVQNALGPRWQARAQWCANLAIINTLAQMETTAGALKFPGLQATPPTLLRKPLSELSNMDGTFSTSATADNFLLLYGDFQQFIIVDRIGAQLEFLPMVIGANRRPTGKRGALLWWRTGSDVVVDGAFKVLNIATTA
ncbi:phage major capsid protein [Actinomadura sp. KC06]|nr:phage major capsid protein [Actinomadura sp. KC06]